MEMVLALLIAMLAGSSAAPQPAPKAPHGKVPEELVGRSPGKTQRCVPFEPGRLFNVSRSDPHVLLYEKGKTIWASKLPDNCSFEAGQTVVPDSNASYYCSGDLVRAGERITLEPFGALCAVGEFTAYSAK